jgi:hypothetical protein
METLNLLLQGLKEDQNKLSDLEKTIELKRLCILNELNKENLKQYKNDLATVSFVERKTIKYIAKKEEVLNYLQENKLEKYIEVIPEQIIPESKQINKSFEDDLKNNVLHIEGVEVETKESPMIRFA